jgi:hypothetical protein
MYAKSTLNGDRMYYREWCGDRGGSEGKSDGFSFEKAMGSHFNKAMGHHFKNDGFSFQKAMGSHFKKRWVLISKSDESSCQFELTTTLRSHDSRSQFEWFWWGEAQFEWVLVG